MRPLLHYCYEIKKSIPCRIPSRKVLKKPSSELPKTAKKRGDSIKQDQQKNNSQLLFIFLVFCYLPLHCGNSQDNGTVAHESNKPGAKSRHHCDAVSSSQLAPFGRNNDAQFMKSSSESIIYSSLFTSFPWTRATVRQGVNRGDGTLNLFLPFWNYG